MKYITSYSDGRGWHWHVPGEPCDYDECNEVRK